MVLKPTRGHHHGTSLMAQMIKKKSACNAGDPGSTPGSGRSPGEGSGFQYSCLENSMDRGAWWVIVHKSQKESDMTEWPTLWLFTSFSGVTIISAPYPSKKYKCICYSVILHLIFISPAFLLYLTWPKVSTLSFSRIRQKFQGLSYLPRHALGSRGGPRTSVSVLLSSWGCEST